MEKLKNIAVSLLRDFICSGIGFLIILLINDVLSYLTVSEMSTTFSLTLISMCYISAIMISIRLRRYYESGSLIKDLLRKNSKEKIIEKQEKIIEMLKKD